MATIKSTFQHQSWRRDQFLVSTDHRLIPISKLVDIFDSPEFYWAKSLPIDAMQAMIENSLCFGVYEEQSQNPTVDAASTSKFVGLARLVTDYTTFAYLTDVWVDPTYQGKGLGSWLVKCIQEVLDDMPHLRRSLLFTADWGRSVPFYQKLMGMKLIETEIGKGLAIMERKGRGHPSYFSNNAGYD